MSKFAFASETEGLDQKQINRERFTIKGSAKLSKVKDKKRLNQKNRERDAQARSMLDCWKTTKGCDDYNY